MQPGHFIDREPKTSQTAYFPAIILGLVGPRSYWARGSYVSDSNICAGFGHQRDNTTARKLQIGREGNSAMKQTTVAITVLAYFSVMPFSHAWAQAAIVDLGDRDVWLVAAGSLPGDSNLDGINSANDLNAVGSHWVPNNTGVTSWSDGDFNGDGIVDPTDLNTLGRWWFKTAADFSKSAADANSVPEPSQTQLVLISLIALFHIRYKCRDILMA